MLWWLWLPVLVGVLGVVLGLRARRQGERLGTAAAWTSGVVTVGAVVFLVAVVVASV